LFRDIGVEALSMAGGLEAFTNFAFAALNGARIFKGSREVPALRRQAGFKG